MKASLALCNAVRFSTSILLVEEGVFAGGSLFNVVGYLGFCPKAS